MPVLVSSSAGDDAGPPEAEALAARVAAGPGSREGEEWLADLRRESLLEALLADGTVGAAASAEHGHKLERALNADVTALSLACGALFPVLGYDAVLALVFGLPGVPARPGTPVPTGSAYSKARERSGEAPARAMFFHDAARTDIPAGQDGTAFGLELTQIDGTTLEGTPPREQRHADAPPQGGRRQFPSVSPGYDRAAGLLHRPDPHPQRPRQDHAGPAADHPPRPGPLSSCRTRGLV
jgi:hypothetical protein